MRATSLITSALAGLVALAGLPANAAWERFDGDDVEIAIVDDYGRELPQYPTRLQERRGVERAYLEAEEGTEYAIRVRNRSDQRVGLVIAVDGRNIISGDKSHLDNDERMYVLRAHESATYTGWRTGRNRVHRFYFTDAGDAYADAFDDHSAMGVIAVAVYREDGVYRPAPKKRRYLREDGGPERGPMAAESYRSEPGTGFGEGEWSPSRRVDFVPERRPAVRYFIKYEWREDLCEKGIIHCRPHRRHDRNRFWPDDDRRDQRWDHGGYAPYPPDHWD
jgi:hypothetical protein